MLYRSFPSVPIFPAWLEAVVVAAVEELLAEVVVLEASVEAAASGAAAMVVAPTLHEVAFEVVGVVGAVPVAALRRTEPV